MKTLKTLIVTAALFAAFNSNAQEAFGLTLDDDCNIQIQSDIAITRFTYKGTDKSVKFKARVPSTSEYTLPAVYSASLQEGDQIDVKLADKTRLRFVLDSNDIGWVEDCFNPPVELAICPIDYLNEYIKAKADFDVYEYDTKFRGVFDYAFDFDGDSLSQNDDGGCTINARWGSSGTGGILTTNLSVRADFDIGATPSNTYMDFRMYLGITGVADEDAPIEFHNRKIYQPISTEEYSACVIDLSNVCSDTVIQ